VFPGNLGPLGDRYMVRDVKTQGIARDLDARGNEEQPRTA
jgi:hypothetical protein